MSADQYISCEIRASEEVTWWYVASFEYGSARQFSALLTTSGLARRGHPPDSYLVDLDLLNEERAQKKGIVYFDQPHFSPEDLDVLLAQADDEDRPTFLGWLAFAHSWQAGGFSVRFLSYLCCVGGLCTP